MASERAEFWQVTLLVDGERVIEDVTVPPPVGIGCASAEVAAIKRHEAIGAKDVRALSSRFVRELPVATPDDTQPTTVCIEGCSCWECVRLRRGGAPQVPNALAPTTQRSPLPLAEQAAISGLVIHDTMAALGAEGQRHLDLWASELRGRLATVQLSLEALWQGQGGDDVYHEGAEAIGKAVALVEGMRGGK